MCVACAINGHDPEDHPVMAQTASPIADPIIKDSVDRQIEFAREALNEAFTAYIEEQRVNIEQTDYQAMSIMNGFFVYMMK